MIPPILRQTKDYCKSPTPVALLIGQDPRLQKSDTVAEYVFFADYYFKDSSAIKTASDRSKRGLATAAIGQIVEISDGKIKADGIYVTNLCNVALPHSRSVLIPEYYARDGVNRIKAILRDNPSIKYIFPMGCQVNYWLAHFAFYPSGQRFLSMSRPDGNSAIKNQYRQSKPQAFLEVCGKRFPIANNRIVIPILHAKNYPIQERFSTYKEKYSAIVNAFHNE